jgi:hypothetical protein
MENIIQVFGHPDGGVEIHLIDGSNSSENVADLTPKQTDELIARLTMLRAKKTA